MLIGGSVSVSVLAYTKPSATKPKPVVIVPPAGTLVLQPDFSWATSDGSTVGSLGTPTQGAPVILPTSSGLAMALFQARLIAQLAQSALWPMPAIGTKTAPYSPSAPVTAQLLAQLATTIAALVGGLAGQANADGPAIVSYFTANAVVDAGSMVAAVTTQQLGELPTSITAGTPIDAPSAPVNIPLAGTGTLQ